MKNKVGSIFLVSMLALAGLGMSYAGFSDTISVFGSVSTATVTLVVEDYSGTWVYKDNLGGIQTYGEPLQEPLPEDWYYVAHAQAYEGSEENTVDMEWAYIFPCIDFMADIEVHYTGSIPAHISIEEIDFTGLPSILVPYVKFYVGEDVDPIDPETWFIQLHNCESVVIKVVIHLPQEDQFQGITAATFSFDVYALQWNDECTP